MASHLAHPSSHGVHPRCILVALAAVAHGMECAVCAATPACISPILLKCSAQHSNSSTPHCEHAALNHAAPKTCSRRPMAWEAAGRARAGVPPLGQCPARLSRGPIAGWAYGASWGLPIVGHGREHGGVGGECPAGGMLLFHSRNATAPSTPPRPLPCRSCSPVLRTGSAAATGKDAAPVLTRLSALRPLTCAHGRMLPPPATTLAEASHRVLRGAPRSTCAPVACPNCVCHARAHVRCARWLILLPSMQLPRPVREGMP